jgi:hypothetical protein
MKKKDKNEFKKSKIKEINKKEQDNKLDNHNKEDLLILVKDI